ncbi:squalene synthase-like [Saccoglossus kowalevskii]
MAIATLASCYDNQDVFKKVVKIRKGQAVSLMMQATNMENLKSIMYNYAKQIQKMIPPCDPSSDETTTITTEIMELSKGGQVRRCSPFIPIYVSCGMMLTAIVYQYWTNIVQIYDDCV